MSTLSVPEIPFLFHEDGPPMTLQIGMVGTDGVVIVGDKKWYGEAGGYRETHHATKFKFDQQKGIAIACAEAEISRNIATRILEELQEKDYASPEYALQRIADGVGTGFRRFNVQIPQAHCLVVVSRPKIRLFSLRLGLEGADGAEIEDKRRAGDPGNLAMFFVDSYYGKRPIRQLVFLGAHVVLTAPRFNSDGIGGLEILLCDRNGFQVIPETYLKKLRRKSLALEEKPKSAFLTARLS